MEQALRHHRIPVSEARKRSIWLVVGIAAAGAAVFWFVHILFFVQLLATFVNMGLICAGVAFGVWFYRSLPLRYEKWARITAAILAAVAATMTVMYLTRSWHIIHDFRAWYQEVRQ
ncbi:MAG TPA: hypothetical protein VG714_05110 [Acidobacteriaceae bacterium]|nr:hypothetical protein [Acidobacteriaceae bacterium]